MSLEKLLEARAEWLKRSEFLGKLTLAQHEAYHYFPTYFYVLADYDKKIAQAYELETEESVFPVETKEVNYH